VNTRLSRRIFQACRSCTFQSDVTGLVSDARHGLIEKPMRIATFNVNAISARLSALRRWLAEFKPNVAFLQELKAPQEKFGEAAREAGYGVI
jgi:hypothetical protein